MSHSGTSHAASKAALRGTKLSKRYDETIALANVDLTLPKSQIVGLVGENGAGKSTLLNILSGIALPDSGALEVHGTSKKIASYVAAQRLGISRVFQEQALISAIPVFENLLLGCEVQFSRLGQFLRRREMIAQATAMVEAAGANIDVTRTTSDLSFSERQMIEIIRACMAPTMLFGVESPIVLLDEPTASLERADEELFFNLLEKTRRFGAVLFVSHRLTEVLRVCDEIVVLKDGRRVDSVDPHDIDERGLHRLMVGRERDADYYHESEQLIGVQSDIVFAARSITKPGTYADISLEVRAGEILGIGGLLESGKSELGKGLAGIDSTDRGEVSLDGKNWEAPNVQQLVSGGLGYVPAERLVEGMIATQPVTWNITLASGGDLFSNPLGIWRHRLEIDVSARLIARLGIKVASAQQLCSSLSGGNQQKVVLARWLARQLRVLILDNPTRGIDAGAKAEIYGLLRSLSREGVGIVLITDELLELIGLSNRIAIMRHGCLSAVIDAPAEAKPTEQMLVAMMLDSDGSELRSGRAA